MQPFEVQPRWRNNQWPAAELRPTELLCQFPVIFPGSHIVLISMLHKFCNRMQAASLKLTLIEKPRPRPTGVRRELGGPEGNTRADLSAFRDHRRDREHQDKAKSPKGKYCTVVIFLFLFFFLLWSSKNKNSVSGRLFSVVKKDVKEVWSAKFFSLFTFQWTFFFLPSSNRGWPRLQKPGFVSLESSQGLFNLIKQEKDHR